MSPEEEVEEVQFVYFLKDCPFAEKDRAKALGAQWNASKGKWFVSAVSLQAKHQNLQVFAKWNPVLYLECPFDEKGEAKQLGARWDAQVKQWYIQPLHNNSNINLASFSKWLPTVKKKKKTQPAAAVAIQKKKKAPKKIDWTQYLKVSSSLSMAQLSAELLHRQPNRKGLSNKTKTWFLEELGVGSIWTSVATNECSKQQQRQIEQQPRVSVNLTVAQLKEELQARDPNVKGLSNKSKPDLLKLLAIDSVWTTTTTSHASTATTTTEKSTAGSVTAPHKEANKKEYMTKQSLPLTKKQSLKPLPTTITTPTKKSKTEPK